MVENKGPLWNVVKREGNRHTALYSMELSVRQRGLEKREVFELGEVLKKKGELF